MKTRTNYINSCKEILSEWNLLVNESKTEFVKCYLAGSDEIDEKGEPIKNKDPRSPWFSFFEFGSSTSHILCWPTESRFFSTFADSYSIRAQVDSEQV
jgi:hypothetical protein